MEIRGGGGDEGWEIRGGGAVRRSGAGATAWPLATWVSREGVGLPMDLGF